jgi:tetratricopeptide (TPR) repeat protein
LTRSAIKYKQLVEWYPAKTEFACDLAATECNLGNSHHCKKDWLNAIEHYDIAISALSKAQSSSELAPRLVGVVIEAYRGRAKALEALHRHIESAQTWSALRDIDRQRGPIWNTFRIMQLVKAGQKSFALEEVEQVINDPQSPNEAIYNSACILSVLGELDRAVKLLDVIEKRGYFQNKKTIDELDKDSDLAPLRSRDDYSRLRSKLVTP